MMPGLRRRAPFSASFSSAGGVRDAAADDGASEEGVDPTDEGVDAQATGGGGGGGTFSIPIDCRLAECGDKIRCTLSSGSASSSKGGVGGGGSKGGGGVVQMDGDRSWEGRLEVDDRGAGRLGLIVGGNAPCSDIWRRKAAPWARAARSLGMSGGR